MGGLEVGYDFTWQALGMIEWKPLKYASFIACYRAVGMDYEDGSSQSPDYLNLDATVNGPVLSINFSW